MNLFGALLTSVLVLVVLGAPRRWAMLGMMAGVLYLTQAQAIDVLGFNMFAVRFLELAGFFRVMFRQEFSFSRLNKTDRALLLAYAFTAIVYSLRSKDGQAYIIGTAVDASLCYFTFRGLIADMEDFRWFLCAFVVLLVPYTALVLLESVTHHNPLAFLGAGMYDWERDGRFRCVGTFRHPDLLGTLGASFLPLYIALACAKVKRPLVMVAIGCCLVIVWASNSGGPVCAAVFGLIGWAFWTARTRMQLVRRAMVAGIALTAMVMKAPVWYLLARASDIIGGSGWHRSYLMDVAFRHLGEWWLAGMPTTETSDWFPYVLLTTGGADITNEFISFGLNAGLGAIALLILLLTRAFSSLGEALANVRSDAHEPNATEFLLWGLGVMLAVHVVNWLGIAYFDQFYVVWFMQLAAIVNLTTRHLGTDRTIEMDEAEGQPEEEVVLGPEGRAA
jgi:hypothetical protein